MTGSTQALYHTGDIQLDKEGWDNRRPLDPAGFAVSVSVFADRPATRGEIRDDAMGAGFRLSQEGPLGALQEGTPRALGEIVLVDCPLGNVETLAALARLDTRVSRSGARLIVSTTMEGLDATFLALSQSDPQILVDPTRAERIVALGRTLAGLTGSRVRELSNDDRTALLRLTEQVAQIARQMDRLAPPSGETLSGDALSGGTGRSAFSFESPKQGYNGPSAEGAGELAPRQKHRPRPALPDPRLVRQVIRHRQLRAKFFEGDLFADPAWDMLLDLTAARAEHERVSVSSLCIASGVPPTTALRWISQLIEAGLLERVQDDTDKRRAFIALTDSAADAMASYFAELGAGAGKVV